MYNEANIWFGTGPGGLSSVEGGIQGCNWVPEVVRLATVWRPPTWNEDSVSTLGAEDSLEITAARRILERTLSEWRVAVVEDDLSALEGYMLRLKQGRKIVIHRGLSAGRQLYITMHCLGHIFLGHEPEGQHARGRASVICDVLDRNCLPGSLQLQCQQADKWVTKVVLYDLPVIRATDDSVFLRGVQRALEFRRRMRSRWRLVIEHTVDFSLLRVRGLTLLYRLVRQNAAAQQLLAWAYRAIENLQNLRSSRLQRTSP